MKEMVAADSSLFSKPSRSSRQAAQGVVQALLASKATSVSTQNPGVLAAKGEGGSAPGPPRRDKGGGLKFQIGACLQQQYQLRVLAMLDNNTDRFAFSLEDIEPFTGEPLRIYLNSDKPIFRPPHKLGVRMLEMI